MKRLLVITGPTASGKTDVAISVAQEINGAIVSADSRQVYAGMNIGTAKPEFSWSDEAHGHLVADQTHPLTPSLVRAGENSFSPDKGRQGGVSHYLFNIRHPSEPLSLSEWQLMAFAAIDHVRAAGPPAVVAGGTMLYIDSIIKNYDLPQVAPNPALRADLEAHDTSTLYAQLLAQDPDAQAFIQPDNKRRIIRALEVMAATNQPFSVQRRQRPPRYDVTMIGLFDSWEALEQRITARVAGMLEAGLVEETQRLINRYGGELPLLQTMNYKQALGILNGDLSREEAQQEMVRANVRYARRQMSWWRGRSDITWYSSPSTALKSLLKL